jgi:hypothetical protein
MILTFKHLKQHIYLIIVSQTKNVKKLFINKMAEGYRVEFKNPQTII